MIKDKGMRSILNNLVQDCQDMDSRLDIVNLSVTLAEQQIIETILARFPEKKDSPKGKDCDCMAYGECECGCFADWADNDGYNEAIDQCCKAVRGE